MIDLTSLEWSIHLATSWALFGLIWTVQLSHYPTFRFIAEKDFPKFHDFHTSSIVLIVMPLMLIELGICCWQTYLSAWNWRWLMPLLMVLLIWASTFFIQIPLHSNLKKGKDEDLIEQLVKTNWIRTILWSIKALWISLIY